MKPILPKGTLAIKCAEDTKTLQRIIAPPGVIVLIIPSDQINSNLVKNIRIDSILPPSSESRKLLPKKNSEKVSPLDKQYGSSSCGVVDGESFTREISFENSNRSYVKEISYQDINGEHEQILYKNDANSLQAKKFNPNSEENSTPEHIQIELPVNSPPPYESHISDPSVVVIKIDSNKSEDLSKDTEQTNTTSIYCPTTCKVNNISNTSTTSVASNKLDTASDLVYLSNSSSNNSSDNNNNSNDFYVDEEPIEDLSVKYETDSSFEFNNPTPRLSNATVNYDGDFSTLNKICNSSSYDNNAWCYSSNEDQPKDYSCTSILNESSEKQDCDKVEFLDSLVDLSQILYYPEKESSYEERRNFAKTLLSSGIDTDRKKIMHDTFWIVEDEPLEASIIMKSEEEKKSSEESENFLFRNPKPSRKYVCHICGKILKGRSGLRPHINFHMNIKPYQCKYCSKKFTQSSVLKNHIRIHTGETPYKCSTCGKGFKTLSIMRRHTSKHSTQRPFKCNTCPKAFKSKVDLQSHKKKTHKSGPHSCQYCDTTFEGRRSLSTHIQRRHKNQKEYKCSICTKTYHSEAQLKQHMNVHTKEEKFNCNICGAAYIWRSGLAAHMRTHSFRIQCEICGVKFTSLKKLETHRLRHANPYPHKCTKCDKRFKFSSHMKKHVAKHVDELFCKECNIGFIAKSKFNTHLKKIHPQSQT